MILTAREWAPNSKVGADFGEDASRCRRWPETVPIMKFVLRWLTNATHDGRFANCSFGIPVDKLSYKKNNVIVVIDGKSLAKIPT